MTAVRSSASLWREGSGYYTEDPRELQLRPMVVDPRRLRDRRVLKLFERYGNLAAGSRVLEVGCGRSVWLPHLQRQERCVVVGVDIEPFAAELARANLAGAGASGTIRCRDAFDPEGNADLLESFDLVYSMGVIEHFDDAVRRLTVLKGYLGTGGRILTTVPNLQGLNWCLQRTGDPRRLEMHVIYDPQGLAAIHEQAGFETIASGYVGFFDGYVTASGGTAARVRREVHRWTCRVLSLCGEAWVRSVGRWVAPETRWTSPHVFYVGQRDPSPGA